MPMDLIVKIQFQLFKLAAFYILKACKSKILNYCKCEICYKQEKKIINGKNFYRDQTPTVKAQYFNKNISLMLSNSTYSIWWYPNAIFFLECIDFYDFSETFKCCYKIFSNGWPSLHAVCWLKAVLFHHTIITPWQKYSLQIHFLRSQICGFWRF